MRVTDLTKQNAVIRNIQKNSAELQIIQENMSSGRRINRLSDDPLGATQAQDYRTKISYFDMLRHITGQTFIWLDRTESEMAHVGDLLVRTKTLVLSQANDSMDEASRRVTAGEVQHIIDALVQSGNSKIGKIFLFSGSKTLTQPLTESKEVNPAVIKTENIDSDLKFLLDPEQFTGTFAGFSSKPYIVRISKDGPIGRAHYVVSDDGGKTWSKENTLLPVLEVFNENGHSSDKVFMRIVGEQSDKLGEPIIFPNGLEFVFEPNPPIQYHGNDDKRMVPTSEGILQPINLTAREIYFKMENDPDSIDIFDMLFSLKRALADNDRRVLEERLGDLDDAFEQVLNKRADMGAVRRKLEEQLEKVGDRAFNNMKQLSELEDLDFPTAVVEMNMADVRNKASLNTSARLLQPSLLQFLR